MPEGGGVVTVEIEPYITGKYKIQHDFAQPSQNKFKKKKQLGEQFSKVSCYFLSVEKGCPFQQGQDFKRAQPIQLMLKTKRQI